MELDTNRITILNAAFGQASFLQRIYGDDIPWRAIDEGFVFQGEKIHLANKAAGIFKPRQFTQCILSIKTTEPRAGRTNIYNDLETDEGFFRYSLQAGDPKGGRNKHLWEACKVQSPFIYFHAVAEGVYKAIWPCFITHIDPQAMFCEVVVGIAQSQVEAAAQSVPYRLPTSPERAYAIRETKVRLYQATFRENVLTAYQSRCAVSGMPVRELLEAAHITPDTDANSSADVTNGIALSRLHHRAYDSNLIGISPDLKVVVSERLLRIRDGEVLKALVSCHDKLISSPQNKSSAPDRDRLRERFKEFQLLN